MSGGDPIIHRVGKWGFSLLVKTGWPVHVRYRVSLCTGVADFSMLPSRELPLGNGGFLLLTVLGQQITPESRVRK